MSILSTARNLVNRALLGGRRVGRAALVRTLAGTAVGAPLSRPRRGTVLILILGALALISVITLIYTSVGQADRRASQSTRIKADVSGTVSKIGDYIRQQIGDGVFAVRVDGSTIRGGQQVPVLVRQAADYPYTDPFRRSIIPGARPLASGAGGTDYGVFDPTGSFSLRAIASGGIDTRQPSTPALASSEPSWIITANPTPPQLADSWAQRLDWLHITNLSPDGRFVNLANLRGNFDALSAFVPPGSATNITAVAPNDQSRLLGTMSYGLTLLKESPAGSHVFVPTFNLENGASATLADVNNPAHWADRQFGLFMPAAGPAYYGGNGAVPADPLNPAIKANSPGSVLYPPYQFADADGDGFFDSRWFELVNASDPNNPFSVLPNDGRFRWFIAARVVDLSASVNVNTASDFKWAPRAKNDSTGGQLSSNQVGVYPSGLSPSDVDLHRLLTLDDVRHEFGFAYDALYRPQSIQGTGQDYGGASGYNPVNADAIGQGAYNALRLVLRSNGSAVPPARANLYSPQGGFGPPRLLGDTPDANVTPPNDEHFDERVTYYQRFGGQPDAHFSLINSGIGPAAPGYELSGRFGIADLLELETYWGLNDPGTTSRLEQTLEGRTAPPPALPFFNFGPLRSNRGLDIERAADVSILDNQGLGNGVPDDASPNANNMEGATPLHRMAADVRHRITPISAARPLTSSIISSGAAPAAGLGGEPLYLTQLDPVADLRVDARKALHDAAGTNGVIGDPATLFNAYVRGLIPQIGRAQIWQNVASTLPMWYGYDPATPGRTTVPELALRIAGQMTANAIDAFDKGDKKDTAAPRGFTLALKRNPTLNPSTDYPFWNQGAVGKLDLGALLPDQPPDIQPVSPAINIYGIEAQPFITMAACMCVYVDAPPSAGGDREFSGTTLPDQPTGIEITIEPPMNAGNHDALGEFLVFQLTNPFNVDVELSEFDSDPSTNYVSNGGVGTTVSTAGPTSFYLEFGGRRFKLADFSQPGSTSPNRVRLRAGESRVFVAMSAPIADLQAKWTNVCSMIDTTNAVRNFVNAQFSIERTPGVNYDPSELVGNQVKPIIIRPMDDRGQTQAEVYDMLAPAVNGDDYSERIVRLWRTVDTGGGNLSRHADMLADRLRDPRTSGTPSLDRRLRGGGGGGGRGRIQQTNAGINEDCVTTHAAIAQDNTGVVVAMWGAIRRHDDPSLANANVQPPLGALPAYCIEDKWSETSGLQTHKNLLITENGDNDTPPQGAWTQDRPNTPAADMIYRHPPFLTWPAGVADFRPNVRADLITFTNDFAPATAGPTTKHIIQLWDRTNPGTPKYPLNTIPSKWNFGSEQANSAMPVNYDNAQYTALYPQVHLDDFERMATLPGTTNKVSTLRVVDMLTPLGIGPMWDPTINTSNPTDLEDRVINTGNPDLPPVPGRLTLSEALALALNYSKPDPNPASVFSIYTDIGKAGTGALDRGNLVLDRFAPYEIGAGNAKLPRYPYIPAALHVLDVFTTTDPQYGSLTRGTPGMINLNTAPVEVLRCLPFLSPTTEPDATGMTNAWWNGILKQMGVYQTNPVVTLPQPPTGATPPDGSDMAATLVAVRDRTAAPDRDHQLLSYSDTNPTAAAFDPTQWDGRFNTTMIDGLSESPGLPSGGAVMTAVNRVPAVSGTGTMPGTTQVPERDQIDYLGNEGRYTGGTAANSTVEALSSTIYPSYADTTATTRKPAAIPDSWFEKLEIAGALGGSTSVRSDTFAVWFVVQGYQRSDVENLGPNDPLVPTIAKRYLMVLDRSNVVKKGDRPKVLLFTELPMK